MREIKFKVFYDVSNKIYDVLAIDFIKRTVTIEYKKNKTQVVNLDFCKLMQYTGLKDKNGVEIYEGDIIKHSGSLGYIVYDSIIEYDFQRCDFYIKWIKNPDKFNDCLHVRYEDIEVIGNIYENPELLEKA